jgi:hypothetical protein
MCKRALTNATKWFICLEINGILYFFYTLCLSHNFVVVAVVVVVVVVVVVFKSFQLFKPTFSRRQIEMEGTHFLLQQSFE